jgi:hypothetical protein
VPYPEIFFGICAPVGVDTFKVHTLISEALKKYSYEAEYFKVTKLMTVAKPKGVELVDTPLEDRYDSYIKYANKLREVFGLNYTLSMLCCAAVRNFRRQNNKQGADPESPIEKQAYVFDQFKRKEELDLLRQVYGRLFIVVSVYSEQKTRLENLVNRIASDHSDARLADIVAAGIKRVVYIEPYPKSYAEQLHGDAIVVGKSESKEMVVFEPFIGISPFRYRDLFARDRKRKDDDGAFKPWIDDGPAPVVKLTVATYISNERAVIKLFNKTAREKLASGDLELMKFDEGVASTPSTAEKPSAVTPS